MGGAEHIPSAQIMQPVIIKPFKPGVDVLPNKLQESV